MAERRKTRSRAEQIELDDEELAEEREPALEPETGDEFEAEFEAGDEPEPVGENELADEEEPSANGRAARRRGRARRPARPADANRSSLTAGDAARAALRQIVELTAKGAEGITGVQRTEDGWMIGVEVVEDRRIPSSADILATYETAIDADGELLSYQRVRRYPRGRGDSSRES